MRDNTRSNTRMARQEFCGKIPSPPPGLHDTIHSGKDTSKPVRSSGLGQFKDSCPSMRPRSCSKLRQKASIKKNWLSQGIKHGLTKPTLQTPLYSTCSQSPPRLDIIAKAATTGKHTLQGKNRHTELAFQSARHHPFGKGYWHTGTVLGPVQGSEHGLQILASKELQLQTLSVRESEMYTRSQTRTPQQEADIQSRSMRSTHPSPLCHLYAKTSQRHYAGWN